MPADANIRHVDALIQALITGRLSRLSAQHLDALLLWLSGSKTVVGELIDGALSRQGLNRTVMIEQALHHLDQRLFAEEGLPHAVLGLSFDVDEDTLKTRYRRLILIYHPDRDPTRAEWLTRRTETLNTAYAAFRRLRRQPRIAPIGRRPAPPPLHGQDPQRTGAGVRPFSLPLRARLGDAARFERRLVAVLTCITLVSLVYLYLHEYPLSDFGWPTDDRLTDSRPEPRMIVTAIPLPPRQRLSTTPPLPEPVPEPMIDTVVVPVPAGQFSNEPNSLPASFRGQGGDSEGGSSPIDTAESHSSDLPLDKEEEILFSPNHPRQPVAVDPTPRTAAPDAVVSVFETTRGMKPAIQRPESVFSLLSDVLATGHAAAPSTPQQATSTTRAAAPPPVREPRVTETPDTVQAVTAAPPPAPVAEMTCADPAGFLRRYARLYELGHLAAFMGIHHESIRDNGTLGKAAVTLKYREWFAQTRERRRELIINGWQRLSGERCMVTGIYRDRYRDSSGRLTIQEGTFRAIVAETRHGQRMARMLTEPF